MTWHLLLEGMAALRMHDLRRKACRNSANLNPFHYIELAILSSESGEAAVVALLITLIAGGRSSYSFLLITNYEANSIMSSYSPITSIDSVNKDDRLAHNELQFEQREKDGESLFVVLTRYLVLCQLRRIGKISFLQLE